MNIFHRWLNFIEPERYFWKLSRKNLDAIKNINKLNEKRKDLQNEIAIINQANSIICHDCKGECCKGDYNHFTLVDYLIRIHSSNPIAAWETLSVPPSIFSLVYGTLKKRIKSENDIKYETGRTTKCPELENGSCKLLPEYRPIRCMLWTCVIFRKSLPPEKLVELGKLNIELKTTIKKVMKIYSSFG